MRLFSPDEGSAPPLARGPTPRMVGARWMAIVGGVPILAVIALGG